MSGSLEANTLFSTKGMVCVVTGGGTGIGLMIATALEANGAKVYIVGRRADVLEKAAKESAKHGNIIPIVGDVTSKSSLEEIVNKIKSDTGYINLLVCNSGITRGQHVNLPKPAPFPSKPEAAEFKTLSDVKNYLWQDDPEDWHKTFQLNVTGVYYTAVAFLELLDEGNKRKVVEQTSQIVTVSSIAAFNRAVTTSFSYSASKAASLHLAKQLATNFSQWDIRSNAIAPGIYPSEMTLPIPKLNRAAIPMQRPGTDQDMAGAILYLASRAGAYVTGNVVITDGGRLSIHPATY